MKKMIEQEFMRVTLKFLQTAAENDRGRLATAELLGVARYLTRKMEMLMTTFDDVAAKLVEAQTATANFKSLMLAAIKTEQDKEVALQAAEDALQKNNEALQAQIDLLKAQIAAGAGTVTSDQLDSLITGLQAIVTTETPDAVA